MDSRHTNDPGTNKKGPAARTALLLVLLIAVGVAAYLPSFAGVFLFDDQGDIVDNEQIRRLWPITDVMAGKRRPVVDLSFAVNYAISELNVWSYHALNLIIHLLAGLTLFGIVRRTMLMRFPEHNRHRIPWLAFAVAAIWIVHPLQTQAVTYIVQRGESLMGMFYLLTLYCVIRGADSRRAPWWYIAAVASCALGMGTKAIIVTAPLVVLVYDRVFLARSFAELLRRRWPLHLGLAATWGVLVWLGIVRSVLLPTKATAGAVGFSFTGMTPLEYALTQPGVILHYLKLCVWPDVLCLDYAWPVAQSAGQIIPQTIAIALLLCATAWALWRRSSLGFIGAWFFIILAPTSSFIPIEDPAFEHRMYLPLAAVLTLVVLAGNELARRLNDRRQDDATQQTRDRKGPEARRRPRPLRAPGHIAAICLVLIVIATLAYRTALRNRQYQSAEAIWRDTVAQNPDNARAHNNFGNALQDAGKPTDAVSHFRRALELAPDRIPARYCYNLANALTAQGQLAEAIRWYRRALDINPDYADALTNLGNVLAAQGLLTEALDHYHRSLTLQPDNPATHYNLGRAHLSRNEPARAIAAFTETINIDPGLAEAHYSLGLAMVRAQRAEEALACFREAARLQPDWPDPLSSMAWILATSARDDLRQPPEAIRLAQRAVSLTGGRDINSLGTLAAAYAAAGLFDEAVTTAQRALDRALATGDQTRITQMHTFLQLYQQGKPYRQPPHPTEPRP